MRRIAVAILAWLAAATVTLAGQMATAERLESSGWWPTKRAARDDFVGAAACAACHARQAATQPSTSMARTGGRAADSEILARNDSLTFRAGAYTYSIGRQGADAVYTVTDGRASRSTPLAWAFGAGKVGQSFLFQRGDTLHEARASYYASVRRLDFTPNRALASPRDLDDATARGLDEAEGRRCFGCHTTATFAPDGRVDFARLMPGITCEACHGPGRAHVAAMRASRIAEGRAAIVNPRTLDAADSIDFCGSCHATFWDVKLADERGIAALRSQPYRLQSSRCWSAGDARLTCVACHDPHQPLVREAAAYDATCLGCHVAAGAAPTASHPGRACRVGTASCASCHMPKYDVPGMHFRFTDHLIRN